MTIEILSMTEEGSRCRISFIYGTRIKSSNGFENDYLIDLNHRVKMNGKGIEFEKNTAWDYKGWPLDCAVLSIVGNGNHTDEICKYFNEIYRSQEKEWRK